MLVFFSIFFLNLSLILEIFWVFFKNKKSEIQELKIYKYFCGIIGQYYFWIFDEYFCGILGPRRLNDILSSSPCSPHDQTHLSSNQLFFISSNMIVWPEKFHWTFSEPWSYFEMGQLFNVDASDKMHCLGQPISKR